MVPWACNQRQIKKSLTTNNHRNLELKVSPDSSLRFDPAGNPKPVGRLLYCRGILESRSQWRITIFDIFNLAISKSYVK